MGEHLEFAGESLRNRLAKNLRRLASWRQRHGLDAFRLYDRDMPEFPFAIDCYGDCAVIHYFDRKPRPDIAQDADEQRAALEISGAIQVVTEFLKVPTHQVFVKRRFQRSEGSQYEKLDQQGVTRIVGEQGLKFRINLSDYLDTGLFLDHRKLRAMVRARASGRRVLNLFCYTGAISVYAAVGGAQRVTSVDLSHTYLEWARDNFRLNGFDDLAHDFLQKDVISFLSELAKGGRQKYDLIVVDPPSFSNSKRMDGYFDIQKHHLSMLEACAAILEKDGELLFSTNLRSFKLAEDELSKSFRCKEITASSLPEDFRNEKIHKLFSLLPLS